MTVGRVEAQFMECIFKMSRATVRFFERKNVMSFRTSLGISLGVFVLLMAIGPTTEAQTTRELNTVHMRGGIEIILPELPTDPIQLEAFKTLTPTEQDSFYRKRVWLIEKLAGGLTKPGIGSAIRWTKDKVTTLVQSARPKQSHAEVAVGEDAPDRLSEKAKIFVDTTITSLVGNLWANSVGIAKSSGVGVSLVVGGIWNTTLGKWGFIEGRSISIDIGADFETNRGYMNIFMDRQSKSQGGFSIDVGLMFDLFLHFTDPKIEVGETRLAVHHKLPIIGSFRNGPNYRAWGTQLGIHVVEIGAAVATVLGYPEAGVSAVAITRGLGWITVYRTNLESRVLKKTDIPPDHWILKRLGFTKALEAMSTKTCRHLFLPN